MGRQIRPILGQRIFHPSDDGKSNVLYSEIDWSNLDAVTTAVEKRFRWWYIRPAQNVVQDAAGNGGHYGFGQVLLTCPIIDMLSQYQYGLPGSRGEAFKDFVDEHFPDFAGAGQPNINLETLKFKYDSTLKTATDIAPANDRPIESFADALYSGYRCGGLHENHVGIYAVIGGGGPVVRPLPGLATYSDDNSPCDGVFLNNGALLVRTIEIFETYFSNLRDRDPVHDELRRRFKQKMLWSFGLTVPDTFPAA